jgi:hypothetical protein
MTLPPNNRNDWKSLPGTNSEAYCVVSRDTVIGVKMINDNKFNIEV